MFPVKRRLGVLAFEAQTASEGGQGSHEGVWECKGSAQRRQMGGSQDPRKLPEPGSARRTERA